MATIPGDGFVRYAVETIMDNGDLALNILHAAYDLPGSTDSADLLALVDVKVSAIAAALAPFIDTDATVNEFTCSVWNAVTGLWDNVGTQAISVAGTNTTGSLPSGNAYMLLCRTENTRVAGRVYCPPFCTDEVDDDGEITAAALAALATLAAAYVTPHSDFLGDLTPGVWSRKLLSFFAHTGTVTLPLSMSYQRRRKRGRGV